MGAARARFYSALALFTAWVIALGVMAYTSAEKPRVAGPSASPSSPPP